MANRSWMAALTIVAGIAAGSKAQDAKPLPAPTPTKSAEDTPKAADGQTVRLDLWIAGLGSKGCDIEIKPAHPACSFTKLKKHVDFQGRATVTFVDVKSRSADRDCTFSITIREPGQAVRTVNRGMRLPASDEDKKLAPQSLACYLTSPSLIANSLDEGVTTKR
jgi:hypothetical protein